MIIKPSATEAVLAFVSKYNRLEHEGDKDGRFLVFYTELLAAMAAALRLDVNATSAKFLELIAVLVEKLHQWDDLIDEQCMPIREAYLMAYGGDRMRKIQTSLEVLGLGQLELQLGLDMIERYFRLEQKLIAGRTTIKDIDLILEKGNCDFYLYGRVLDAYLRRLAGDRAEPILSRLEQFLAWYLRLDLLLDHLADFEEDCQSGGFNILLWDARPLRPDWPELYRSGALERFAAIGFDYVRKATAALGLLAPYDALQELLAYYLAGEAEGLRILSHHDYFADLPNEDRQRLLLAVLKPHPWERIPRKEVCNVMEWRETIETLNRGLPSRAVVPLGGRCEWDQCYHCGLSACQVPEIDEARLMANLDCLSEVIETVCLYTAGSWWKPSLAELRPKILAQIKLKPSIKRVIVESRPELVAIKGIEELVQALPGVIFEIGVGLDHVSDRYRNSYLLKGISRRAYERAMTLGRPSVQMMTYVAVGCPFLTERKAIASAVETADYAIRCGGKVVSLEPLLIQDGTIQDFLARQGLFQVPWLWSVVEVVRRIYHGARKHNVEIRIGGEVQAPIPTGYPSNRCPLCDQNDRFRTVFRQFETTQNYDVLGSLHCDCRTAWELALDHRPIPGSTIPAVLKEYQKERNRRSSSLRPAVFG